MSAARPLEAASRRLRRPPGRPRTVRSMLGDHGLADQGAPLAPAPDAAIDGDFAVTLPARGLSLPVAASYSGIPVRRLWALIEGGLLPSVTVPGMRTVLILRDDLDGLLEGHRVRGPRPGSEGMRRRRLLAEAVKERR